MEIENSNLSKKYLRGRYEEIKKRRTHLMNQCNKNQLEATELTGKISQIRNNIDEAYEIFSPKPRATGFTKTEMAVLAQKQNELLEQNHAYRKEIAEINQEMKTIRQCIELLDNGDVLSMSSDDLNCIEHYYNDNYRAISNLEYQIMEQLEEMQMSIKENVPNKTQYRNIEQLINATKDHIKCYTNNMIPINMDENLSGKVEEIVEVLNRDHSDRIGCFYDGKLDEISMFKKQLILDVIKTILTEMLESYDGNIVLKIAGKETFVNLVFEIDKNSNITPLILKLLKVHGKDSNLTISDCVNLGEGEFVEFEEEEKKQLIVRIKQ